MGALCVLSFRTLGDAAKTALAKSGSSFGYDADACLFVTVCPGDQPEATADSLSATQVLSLVEGLDPFRLIITDEQAAAVCSEGYHRPIPFDEFITLLQRPTIAFKDFSQAIEKEASKQKAWKLLKRLLRTD